MNTARVPVTTTRGKAPQAGAGVLQRKCSCGGTPGPSGECAECRRKRSGAQSGLPLQPKLTVSRPGDRYEREADRIAESIMCMPGGTPDPNEQARIVIAHPGRLANTHPRTHQATKPGHGAPTASAGPHSGGRPLDSVTRTFMQSRLGYDFGRIRVHTNADAAQSARAVHALAYTVGRHVTFADGEYAPGTERGRKLLAHELTHTIQQGAADRRPFATVDSTDVKADSGATPHRAAPVSVTHTATRLAKQTCTAAAVCTPTGVAGSALEFGTSEEAQEVGPRARRKRMTPARATSTGHAGHARQLETFLNSQAPGRMAHVHGIFIDRDLSPGTGAMTQSCAGWTADALPAASPTPPDMVGAVKPCVFVHGSLNRQAAAFNKSSDKVIGGVRRSRWRLETLQTLLHETEHPRFETATAARPLPAGVTSATCTRANLEGELSEIAATMSEFPSIFDAAAAEADPNGRMHRLLRTWFNQAIHTGGEHISGALEQMGCSCGCAEVDAMVIDTFNEVTTTGAWTATQKTDFNDKLRSELGPGRPTWPL